MNSLNVFRSLLELCRCTMKDHRQSTHSFSTWNRHFYLQLLWLATIFCCFSSVHCSEPSTSAPTQGPSITVSFSECYTSLESSAQRQYVCYNNRNLFPILKYAENLSRHWCEEHFKNDRWNCSEFSVLKEPKIASNSRSINKELAYVHAISYAGIALSVAQACATSYPDHKALCQCPEGVNCYDNLTYAFEVADTFLAKRYASSGLTARLDLIHLNYDAAKQHIQRLVDNTEVTCRCHGVSGSCTVKTCNSPILPDFKDVAKSLRDAYLDACRVSSRGTSQHLWDSECGRELTKFDLIYRYNEDWCPANRALGGLGTAGRNCSNDANAPNSCQKLCTQCGRGYHEYQVETESRCSCKFVFCCEITCEWCKGTSTLYACSG